MGGLVQLFREKGWRFPGTALCPLFDLLRSTSDGTGGCVIEHANVAPCAYKRPKLHWKSDIPPSLAWLVLTNFCLILWVSCHFKGRALPPPLLLH